MENEILFKDESYSIMGACFEVYNEKGNGFLEPVYQECLSIEMGIQELPFEEMPGLTLFYKGRKLKKKYEPDFFGFDKIILEIKAVKKLTDEHRAKVINYLKSTGKALGLLVNFGHDRKLEYERLVNKYLSDDLELS